MKRNQFKLSSDHKEEEVRRNFLEELIVKYFERKQEQDDDLLLTGAEFDRDGVYSKVLDTIQTKQNNNRILRRNLRIAASVALLVTLVTAGYYYRYIVSDPLNPASIVEKRAQEGQTAEVTLSDGTKVWLNSGSKLLYPDNFNEKKREVTLVGEAYFEVVHLDKKAFVIHTGDVKTVVLGTSFNIKAYPENQKVEVTVITGKVAVITPGKDKATTVYLTPNQKVTYNSDEMDLKPYAHVKADESIAWKEGKMIYRGSELKQVVEDVERKYNIKINYSKKVSTCKVTVDFNNEELPKVLNVLAKIVDGTVFYKDGSYYLEGNGCE